MSSSTRSYSPSYRYVTVYKPRESTPSPSRGSFVLVERPKRSEPQQKQQRDYNTSPKRSETERKQYRDYDTSPKPKPKPRRLSDLTGSSRPTRLDSEPRSRSSRPRSMEVVGSEQKRHSSQSRYGTSRDSSRVRFDPIVNVRTYRD